MGRCVAVTPFYLQRIAIGIHNIAHLERDCIDTIAGNVDGRGKQPIVAGSFDACLVAHGAVAGHAIGPPSEVVVVGVNDFEQGQRRCALDGVLPIRLDRSAGDDDRRIGPSALDIGANGPNGIGVARQLRSRDVVGVRRGADS